MADESVPVAEFRARLASYLARAHNGEEFTITRAGRIDAQLVPPPSLEENRDHDAG